MATFMVMVISGDVTGGNYRKCYLMTAMFMILN